MDRVWEMVSQQAYLDDWYADLIVKSKEDIKALMETDADYPCMDELKALYKLTLQINDYIDNPEGAYHFFVPKKSDFKSWGDDIAPI